MGTRASSLIHVFKGAFQDLAFGFRTLRRAPAFAATAVLTLGIGLGLNTAPFTIFNAYVLRPIAARDPASLYQIEWTVARGQQSRFNWSQYQAIRSESKVLADAIAWRSFVGRVNNRNMHGALVSGNYFSMLGITASIGRTIGVADALAPGAERVVVLGHRAWQSAFGGDPSIVGGSIAISGQSFDVIGIAPPEFIGLDDGTVDLFVPLTMHGAFIPGQNLFGSGHVPQLSIAGRLRPGISAAQARAALTLQARRLTENSSDEQRAREAVLVSKATAVPYDSKLLASLAPVIVTFFLVLAVCCANVAGMLLARAITRQREIAIRISVGASRSRLVRQLISEGMLLACAAGVVGLAVSHIAVQGGQRVLFSTLPPAFAEMTNVVPLEIDRRVVLFLFAASLVSVFLFAVVPALQATRTSLSNAMRGEFGQQLRSSRLRDTLLVLQVAVCLILVVVTGILVRGGSSYRETNVGFNTSGVQYPLVFGELDQPATVKLAHSLLTDPRVQMVAAVSRPPLGEYVPALPVTAEGREEVVHAGYRLVSPEYFPMLDLPILRGRNFRVDEAKSEAGVVIISQSTAHRFWLNQDPLGRRIRLLRSTASSEATPKATEVVVVGVTKDVVSGMLFDGLDRSMLYFPTSLEARKGLTLLVRDNVEPNSGTRPLEAMLATVLPHRASAAMSLEDALDAQVYPFRAASWIGSVLGVIALLLSASAMYGVMSFHVSQRTKEIGIRMALGATRTSVVRTFLGRSMRLSGMGLGFGILVSLAVSRVLQHFLLRLESFDVLAYAIGAGTVATASLLAAFFPTNRAAGLNPVEAIREQ
jgi:predicted permease